MKKFLSVLILVMLFAGCAFAEGHRVGIFSHINSTEEEFQEFFEDLFKKGLTQVFSTEQKDNPTFVFYDSLIAATMALGAGEIDEILLPEPVAEYVMNATEKYKIACVVKTIPISLAFGFRKDDQPALRNSFNEALMAMKADGTLSALEAKYISEAGVGEPEPVKFEDYGDAGNKVKVAVTGDLPPIDFIKADGTPAGFNTAVLAEISKRLKLNIELVSIESGARSASLASGRSDVVFWFQLYKGVDEQPDVPAGIVLSEPYFTFDEVLHLKLK